MNNIYLQNKTILISLRNGYNHIRELGFGPTKDNMIRWVLDPRRYSFYTCFCFFFFTTCNKNLQIFT